MDDSLLGKLKTLDATDFPEVQKDASTFTATEYAESLGIASRTARERLHRLYKAGKIEKVRIGGQLAWRLP